MLIAFFTATMVTRTSHEVTLDKGLQCVYCIYVLLNYVLIHEIKSDCFKYIMIMHRCCTMIIKRKCAI